MRNLLATIICIICFSCNSVPQPCDPAFVASQQAAIASVCRYNAEKTCPGYSSMSEDKKLECPGVLECLNKIEKLETDCNGS